MKFDSNALQLSVIEYGAGLQTYWTPFQTRPLIQSADAPPSRLRWTEP